MKPAKPDPGKPHDDEISRRQFGRNAAIAAAATLTAPTLLAKTTAAPGVSRPQEKPEPLEGLTPEQTAEVDARLANILRKYGNRFNDDQKARLRRILAQNQRLMAPVRAFSVQNGDPPASVLRTSFGNLDILERERGL
jgi:hypothetical protein